MEDEPDVAPEKDPPLRFSQLRFALRANGAVQFLLFVITLMTFDGGLSNRICIQAITAYWLMTGWLGLRRGNALMIVDAFWIRAGFFLWLVVAVVVEGAVRILFFDGI